MQPTVLSSLVPEAAARRPGGEAVVCADESLTWSGLENRVARLAATLVEAGVNRGDRVGIYLHKSIESMVAVHGILRAGAAYVPIDPLAPIELVSTIVADCGIDVLISHQPRAAGLRTLLPTAGLTTVVGVDGSGLSDDEAELAGTTFVSWGEVAEIEPIDPRPVGPDDLAYVMYTSGSTGRPKGMMHTHRSGLAYALMAADVYGLAPDDRLANFSPLHFDMSTFEMFAGPSAAATAVLVPEPHLRMAASLTQYLSDQRVTTLYTVPSLFIQMMTRGAFDQRDWSSLRWVMPAGEVFPPEPLQELMAVLPHAGFSNVYGPAEVNQITHFHVPRPFSGVMPIGFASPGAVVELIDENDDLLVGPATGELIAAAPTMMRGYWGRPDLDEAGFVERPGSDGRNRRWYRTGDLVERDADGLLMYLGRRDNQVKVRGYRVELEMVESAVGSLPGIEQAVVGLRPGPDGDAVLVAHYIRSPDDGAAGQSAPDATAWRTLLAATLPGYAIPGGFEPVVGFPLTPSGKLDRRTVRTAIAAGPEGADGDGLT